MNYSKKHLKSIYQKYYKQAEYTYKDFIDMVKDSESLNYYSR